MSIPDPTIRSQKASGGGGCLFATVFFIGCVVGGYWLLDDAGWVSHTQTTNIYFKGDWLTGENRSCAGYRFVDDEKGIAGLRCLQGGGSSVAHNIEIKFFGKVKRPDVTGPDEIAQTKYQWRCTRTADGFTCYALN